jgi:hypothetical protein
MSVQGQNPNLPHCNSNDWFTSDNGHYSSMLPHAAATASADGEKGRSRPIVVGIDIEGPRNIGLGGQNAPHGSARGPLSN